MEQQKNLHPITLEEIRLKAEVNPMQSRDISLPILSTQVIRPSGVILETDLVNYLPELTSATVLPPVRPGKIWVGSKKAWIILSDGTPIVFVDISDKTQE